MSDNCLVDYLISCLMCPVYDWGPTVHNTEKDQRICPGSTSCNFLKAVCYKVKKVGALSVTEAVPAADNKAEPTAVPAVVTCRTPPVQSDLTLEE